MDYYRRFPPNWQPEIAPSFPPDVFLGSELPYFIEDTLDAAYNDPAWENDQDFKNDIISCKTSLSNFYSDFMTKVNIELNKL